MTGREGAIQPRRDKGALSRRLTQRYGSWVTQLFVMLLFVAMTLGMTYPLVLNLRTKVPGPPWDSFVWLYDLWWFRHSIIDLGEWPVLNSTIFYPIGYDLRLSETILAAKLLVAPLLFWTDEILSYNVFLLLSFVLTGFFTYLLVAYLTSNRYAAVVSGIIFAFCPYRMHCMAAGWLPLLGTQWIPLSFLFFERALREQRARFALGTGVFLALTFLSSWYYVYVVGSFFVLYVMIRTRPWGETWRRTKFGKQMVSGLLLGAAMVVPVAYPVVLRAVGIGEYGVSMGWPLVEIEKWAASVEDFFFPNIYHPIWGSFWLEKRAYTLRYPWYAPGFVYLGLVSLLLAWRGVTSNALNKVRRPAFWLGLLSLVLALGAVLHFDNQVVELKASPRVEELFERVLSTLMTKWALHPASYYDIVFRSGTVPIPLPGLLVYLFLPLGNAMRTFYRFGVVTMFFVSILAGLGTAHLLGGVRSPDVVTTPTSRYDFRVVQTLATQQGGGKRKRWSQVGLIAGTVVISALVLLDFCSAPLAFGMSEVKPQPIDRWISAQAEDVVVMQFPLSRAYSGDSLYRTKYHGHNVAYGHGTFYPETYQYAMPILGTFPSRESLDLLASWGVTHVIVGSGAYDAGWGDQVDQTWITVREEIEATGRLSFLGVAYDEPIWKDERVSDIMYGNPPVVPLLVDKVHVYELK